MLSKETVKALTLAEINSENHVVMLKSELKDMDNNPIYEGDILSLAYSLNAEVYIKAGAFVKMGEPVGWHLDLEDGIIKTEFIAWKIIGNIHENPEIKFNDYKQ